MRIRCKYKAILFCVLTAVWASVPSRPALSQNLAEDPRLVRSLAHHIMAVAADYEDRPYEATLEYQKAVDFNPNSYLSHLRLGAHLAKSGKLKEALEHLSKVTLLNPDDVQARYLLALIYSAQKQFDKAANEYEIILTVLSDENPDNANIYFYLGQLYYAQFQYDKAIEQFKKIIKLNPKNIEMMNFVGALHVELDQNSEAKAMFRKVLALDSDNDMALNSLGYIYAQQGDQLDEALRLVSRALERVPNSAAYQDTLGWVFYKQGRYQDALEVLQKANEKLVDPVILEHLGDVYLALKQYDQAKDYWSKALKMLPGQKKILEKINRVEILKRNPVGQKNFDQAAPGVLKDR